MQDPDLKKCRGLVMATKPAAITTAATGAHVVPGPATNKTLIATRSEGRGGGLNASVLRALPLALLSLSALAAEPPRNVVLADLGLHVVGIGYQRTLTPFVSAQLAAESYTPWTQNIDLGGLSGQEYKSDLAGIVIRARSFFYPSGSAPAGFWISPFAQGGIGWATRNGERRVGPVWAVGASAGYAVLVGPGIHLSLGLGGQYHVASIPGGDGIPSFARFYPTLDGSIGYAF
jgi:hypothetical protein